MSTLHPESHVYADSCSFSLLSGWENISNNFYTSSYGHALINQYYAGLLVLLIWLAFFSLALWCYYFLPAACVATQGDLLLIVSSFHVVLLPCVSTSSKSWHNPLQIVVPAYVCSSCHWKVITVKACMGNSCLAVWVHSIATSLVKKVEGFDRFKDCLFKKVCTANAGDGEKLEDRDSWGRLEDLNKRSTPVFWEYMHFSSIIKVWLQWNQER